LEASSFFGASAVSFFAAAGSTDEEPLEPDPESEPLSLKELLSSSFFAACSAAGFLFSVFVFPASPKLAKNPFTVGLLKPF